MSNTPPFSIASTLNSSPEISLIPSSLVLENVIEFVEYFENVHP
jgi:hypothetical protein